jgi:hypothetical protein
MRTVDLAMLFGWLISALAVVRSVAIDVQQWQRRQRAEVSAAEADSLRE